VLRVLLTALGTLVLIGLIGVLALTALVTRAFFANPHVSSTQDIGGYTMNLAQQALGQSFQLDPRFFTILLPVLGLLLIALFFLPFTLSVQARLTRGLFGHRTRSPEARRYALRPTLGLLLFHTLILLFAALLANSIYNLGADSVLPAGWPVVSQRLLAYAAALFGPYLLLVDLPFRAGMARWRSARLRELGLRRSEIAQRLSRSQPQATDQADLHTLQDYVTWQYYRTQESDVRDATLAPFAIGRLLLALILAIVGGFALDQLNQLLHSLV